MLARQELGRLAFGGAGIGNLGGAIADEAAWHVLDAAWECGIRYFDTAPHYGLGLSERRLGAFLATKPRSEFMVSTKVGRVLRPRSNHGALLDDAEGYAVPADFERQWDFSADGLRRSLEDSLVRLGLSHVDIVYLHDPERHDLDQGVRVGLPALADLRDEGTVSVIGVGSMSTAALLASVRSEVVDLLMVAGRFTLADQSAAEEVIPECRRRGVGVVDAAVFNSGLLASERPSRDDPFDYRPVAADQLAAVRRIADVCADFGVSLPVAALHYPFREPAVISAVVGAVTPEQVEQNVARLSRDVPDELWARLLSDGLVAV